MQSSNQSPGSGSKTLWVWTTLLLLMAVTTTTPGGQVQAAESPQQQPRDLSLLNRIEKLLEELLEQLNLLLNFVNPTTTAPDETSDAATTPDDGTATPGSTPPGATSTDKSTSDKIETTSTESTSLGTTSTDTSTSDSIDTTTPESTSSGTTSTDISTSDSTETTTPENTSSGTTSTDISTSDSTESTTPESTSSGTTSTDTSTSDSTETTTLESTSSGTTSTDTSTSENTKKTTPESTSSGTTSTDTSTSDSTETTTPESTSSGTTSTESSTSDSTETSTPESTSSGTTSTDTSTSDSTETTILDDGGPGDEEQNNPGTLYLAKRSLAISRKLLVDDNGLCTPEEDNDHCHKLIHVMETIEDVTGKLEEDEVSQDMVNQLENATSEMETILDHKEDIVFQDDITDKIESTIEDINEAKVKVQKDIDAQNKDSQTLVIVLGSVGGFIVVALVATLIFAYYKKRKSSIDDKQKLNTEYVPINSFKEDGHDNPNFYPEVVTAQRPAQPQEVQTYGTTSQLQPKRSQMQDNSTSGPNYYETPSYSMVDEPDSQNVPQRTSYRGGYATETQGQQPTYSRPPADKVPRPNLHGNTNKQSPRPVSGANYDTDHRSPSRPTSKTANDYERKPNRSGYESDVRVPRVAPKPQSSRPYSPPGRSYDEEVKDPYSLDARGNVKRLSGAPAGGLRRVDN